MIALSLQLFFQTPIVGLIGAAILTATIVLFLRRRPVMLPAAKYLMLFAALILAIACANPIWQRPAVGEVAILVDRSASTRGANYRDRGYLMNRITQLLGNARYRISDFSNGDAQETIYSPPSADAIVLFSDGQFALPPHSPPTFPVIDPTLDAPIDGAVSQLEFHGSTDVVANVQNSGPPRRISFIGAENTDREPIGQGKFAIAEKLLEHTSAATAKFAAGDLWPENDSLSINVPSPQNSPRWWVGHRTLGEGWENFSPRGLPNEPTDYLAPPAIVLDNIAADEFSQRQFDRLEQYVRDLGGTLIILGGDRAFAAGGYGGTRLEALSPLASTPPQPTTHWILLVDSSGSMADTAAGSTRWQLASNAVAQLLLQLPPDDPVSAGNFARDLNWWTAGKSARETAKLLLPPKEIAPQGPTNLVAALEQLAKEPAGSLPRQVMVLTDAETQIPNVESLAKSLADKNIFVNFLALNHGSGFAQIQRLVDITGGKNLEQLDPRRWADSTSQLFRQIAPDRLENRRLNVSLGDNVRDEVSVWNRTWSKPASKVFAETFDGESMIPLAARWNIGAGQVVSIAFEPRSENVAKIAEIYANRPADPRFKVSWEIGRELHVTVDAIDQSSYLNSLAMRLDLIDESKGKTESLAIPQTAPGRYELKIPSPRAVTFAAVKQENYTIDRRALAARYAPEFDAIGNNRAALGDLADRSNGQVIEPTQESAIDFHWPPRNVVLTPWLASLAMLLLFASLIVSRKN